MTSTISHTIKHRTSPKDVFYTPEALARKHIAMTNTALGNVGVSHYPVRWLDPFYGKGVYYDNFPGGGVTKDFTEIEMGKDFFAHDSPVDVICSNPPYSCIDRVLEKCVALGPRVISLLLLHGSITPKRMEFMKNAGYAPASILHAKVFKWYGISEAWTFVKSDNWDACSIQFDRVVYR